MSFKIPEKAKNAFDGNMNTKGTVELPFPAPAFYIVNGNAQLAALQNFQYYGGWACNVDKVKEAADHWDNTIYPIPGLQETQIVMDNNQQLNVMAARSLVVAPIGLRQYSSTFDQATGQTRRVAPYTPGARPGMQVLCVLGYRDQSGAIFHWAPILLTAKGYQVNNLQKAITNWQKAIKPVLKKMVPETPPSSIANLFWMSIGTFGKERKQDLVGTGQKKPITPISVFIPDVIDETLLGKLYVGEAMAEFMADISDQAKEWLQAFNGLEPVTAKAAPATVEMNEPPTEFYEQSDDNPFPF